MRRLSVADAAWLLIEGRVRPMHVGGLMLFDPPEGAGPTFVKEVVEGARTETGIRAPFDQRLAHAYGRLGLYHWVEDADVDLDYHLRHLALPEPGRIRELLALVSQLHANLLDRHRPLWEMYLIEGIEDGRFAMYSKVHHSMLDGVAAVRQVLRSFSSDPELSDLPPPWARSADGATRTPERGRFNPLTALVGMVEATQKGITSGFHVTTTLIEQIARAQFDPAEVAPFQAPPSMLNQRLTAARRFVAQSYDLDRIRAVKDAFDATVNDVVLAMCAGALRRYLLDQDALPRRPLVALVPVSFRRDDSDAGNAISLVPATLATHLGDPAARLELIRTSMNRIKDRLKDLTPLELLEYGILMTAPLVLGNLTGISGRGRPSYNVVISNVPGPTEPLYWNGARLDGMYPLSLLTEGYSLNITQTSYAGSMEFGITADRRALPSIQRVIDHLEEALVELEKAAGI